MIDDNPIIKEMYENRRKLEFGISVENWSPVRGEMALDGRKWLKLLEAENSENVIDIGLFFSTFGCNRE